MCKYNSAWFENRQKTIDAFNKQAVERWAENEVKTEIKAFLRYAVVFAIGFLIGLYA